MIAVTRAQRTGLLFISASAYLAWFSGFDGRLEAQGIERAQAPILTIVPRGKPPQVGSIIRRDPFDSAPQSPLQRVAGTNDAPPERGPSPTERTMVPNISESSGDPTLAGVAEPSQGEVGALETLVVRATIVGANPVAYVANGSAMDIVRVGDRLGDRRIARIDLRGIAFSDGSRLDLPGAFIATPTPQKPGAAVTIKLADLRRLLLRPTAQTPPLAPPNGAPAAPVGIATPAAATYPTPGPLPTIDPRGIPVGTNPTPDANGPTPYPNPYPYAPPHR